MNRREFNELGLKLASTAALAGLTTFVKTGSASEEFAWPHQQFKYPLGNFELQSGQKLKDAFILVDAHGTPNADMSNVIVFPTCYAGNHFLNRLCIGTDRALDPSKYFIVIPNMFGCGQSSSPSNTSAPQDGPRFTSITAYDNVIAQKKLLTSHFGIENPLMYVGFSMGGQQAFHWGVLYGDSTGAIVPVAGTAKTSVHNWLFLEGLKKALQADSSFNGGDYKSPPEAGLRAFSTVYASWWYDQTGYREGLHLKTFDGFPDMNAFLDFAYSVFNSFDANDLLAMLNTWQIADVGQQQRYGGDWKAALGDIHCHALVMPSKTDLYFPPEDNEIEVALMPNAELLVIPSKRGHFGGSMVPGLAPEEAFFTDVAIKRLLKRIG